MAIQWEKNPVMQLNEYCVKQCFHPPEWTEVGRRGPSHEPFFTYSVSVRSGTQILSRTGEGKSKQLAKAEAAKFMMGILPDQNFAPVVAPLAKATSAPSDDTMADAVKPKKKPPCFHYKKILAHMKARRNGQDFAESNEISPSFDSKKALADVSAFWGFKCRYETYKLDGESSFQNQEGPVLRVCIMSFQHARPEILRQLQDNIIRPEVFCQGQGDTVEKADEDCAGRALKYLACMNDKLDASA